MKKVTLFYLSHCPHCKRAMEFVKKAYQDFPQFKEIELLLVEESKQPEIANKFDYYLVPTFYVGEDKVHEGTIEYEDVLKVFNQAK